MRGRMPFLGTLLQRGARLPPQYAVQEGHGLSQRGAHPRGWHAGPAHTLAVRSEPSRPGIRGQIPPLLATGRQIAMKFWHRVPNGFREGRRTVASGKWLPRPARLPLRGDP
jgi:hypothetical protein